jgi:hypothetical protein
MKDSGKKQMAPKGHASVRCFVIKGFAVPMGFPIRLLTKAIAWLKMKFNDTIRLS